MLLPRLLQQQKQAFGQMHQEAEDISDGLEDVAALHPDVNHLVSIRSKGQSCGPPSHSHEAQVPDSQELRSLIGDTTPQEQSQQQEGY